MTTGLPGERFLLATESEPLAAEITRLVCAVSPRNRVEVVPEDGPIVLARLKAGVHRLAFLPVSLRHLDSLTLLRYLGPLSARRVVLLAPDTVSGYRAAWEGLALGARDLLPTRGRPVVRLRSGTSPRGAQIELLLAAGEEADPHEAASIEWGVDPPGDAPWLFVPAARHLLGFARWLRRVERGVPIVVRIPEGRRLARVARQELDRTSPWATRALVDRDLLVPGQVHLFAEPKGLRLDLAGARVRARLRIPGRDGYVAARSWLEDLGRSEAPFHLVSSDPLPANCWGVLFGAPPAARTHALLGPLLARVASSQRALPRAGRRVA